MQRWKEEFVGNNQRKCVHVHHNGDFEHGKGKKTIMLLYIFIDTFYDLLMICVI